MNRIRRALPGIGFALGLLIVPALARATTYDVSPTGSGSACTPGSPCALSTANTNAGPGDVIRLAPGSYSSSLSPSRNGTATARITYVGNLANPASTVVPSSTIRYRYISIKGLRFVNDFGFDRVSETQYAQFDSVGWCEVANTLSLDQAKDCIAYKVNVTSGNGRLSLAAPSTPVAAFTIPERNVVRRCTMYLGYAQTTGNHVVLIRGAQNCTIDSNQVWITMAPNITAETDPFIAFYMKWCRFADNRWTVRSEHNADHLFRWRDSTMFNHCYRDTILMSGYNMRFAPSSSGSWPGSTNQNYFEGLVLKNSCAPHDVGLFYQNGSRQDTLRNCVVIDSIGKAFQCLSVEQGPMLVDHCTFAGNSRYGAVDYPCGIGTFGDSWPPGGALRFTNNIIYSTQVAGGGADADVNWQFSASTNDITSNNNLYYVPGQANTRAIRYGINTGATTFSAPGTGQPFNLAWGEDGSSKWGDPAFANATYTGFDPHLKTGSPAIGAATDGTDIGALSFQGGPDTTPPAAVSNLSFFRLYDNSAILSWTAPGDNGMSGTVTQYELRWSASPITTANFASATLVSPQPIPAAGGFGQTYVLLNLTPGVKYYVALRAVDDAGNWSPISNLPSGTTTNGDVTPPSTTTDLSASP